VADESCLVLAVPEVVVQLGLSRAFAYELVARKELPALRLGRRLVVPRAALNGLLGKAVTAAPNSARNSVTVKPRG
jgi:excisionase family DNA binding protein